MIRAASHPRSVKQSGFTAVELLVTLFVAAAFIIAGYQLFNVVIKDGGETRAKSTASNTAYNYLRQYSDSATNPCSSLTPLTNQPVTVAGLSSVTVTVTIACAQTDAPSLSKVDVILSYNNPQQTSHYTTYVDRSKGATPTTDVTDGLVAWYKMNGNANTSVGSANGTVNNATLTTNRASAPNTAYAFNAAAQSQYISINSTFGMGPTNATITLWVNNPTATNSGQIIKIGALTTSGIGLGIGSTYYDNGYPGTKIILLFENVRWIATTTDLGTGWHALAVVLDSSGVPSVYKDGALVGTYAGANAILPASGTSLIGGLYPVAYYRWFNGSVDDTRIYNRALTGSEILQVYNAGPQ